MSYDPSQYLSHKLLTSHLIKKLFSINDVQGLVSVDFEKDNNYSQLNAMDIELSLQHDNKHISRGIFIILSPVMLFYSSIVVTTLLLLVQTIDEKLC